MIHWFMYRRSILVHAAIMGKVSEWLSCPGQTPWAFGGLAACSRSPQQRSLATSPLFGFSELEPESDSFYKHLWKCRFFPIAEHVWIRLTQTFLWRLLWVNAQRWNFTQALWSTPRIWRLYTELYSCIFFLQHRWVCWILTITTEKRMNTVFF